VRRERRWTSANEESRPEGGTGFLLAGTTSDKVLTVFANYRLPSVLVVVAGSCIEYFASGLLPQMRKMRRCKMNSMISEAAKISQPE